MRLSLGRSLSTSGSSSVATAMLDAEVMAGATGRGPLARRESRPWNTPAILSLKYASHDPESDDFEPGSEHSELKSCRFRHHRRVPDRVPDHLDLGPGDAGHALDPVLHLSRQRAGDRTAGGGQGHLDLHPPAGLDVEVVDQPHLVDVDGDLRIVDGLQRLDDAVLDTRRGRVGPGGDRRRALRGFVRFCCHDVSFQLRPASAQRPPCARWLPDPGSSSSSASGSDAGAAPDARADCKACQARVAHLTRIGYSPTPAKAASLPSSGTPSSPEPPGVSAGASPPPPLASAVPRARPVFGPPPAAPPPAGAPVTREWKRSNRRRASPSDLPRSASVIIEADAVEMAQPTPSKAMSSILPSSTRRWTSTRSPQRGL